MESQDVVLAPPTTWEVSLKEAIGQYLTQIGRTSNGVAGTPDRVVRAFTEFASGYLYDPREVLRRSFDDHGGYDQMIHVWRVPIVSTCEHHILPFFGSAHFAYVPDKVVVGLSKIPRFIDLLSRRLQIQERLTKEIVDIFQEVVEPLGCAIQISATHTCMCVRGARARGASMETTAFRGVFQHGEPRMEFLLAQKPAPEIA